MVVSGRLQGLRPLLRRAAGLGLAALLVATPAAQARDGNHAAQSQALNSLPAQAQSVYRSIPTGGPFAYAKDGSVFGNRERLLPARRSGFYREYTVPTPGVRDRGARRIVCGGPAPTTPQLCFYSADHYNTFHLITP